MRAKARSGIVESARSHCQPSEGIMMRANSTSKHAPSAQKH